MAQQHPLPTPSDLNGGTANATDYAPHVAGGGQLVRVDVRIDYENFYEGLDSPDLGDLPLAV